MSNFHDRISIENFNRKVSENETKSGSFSKPILAILSLSAFERNDKIKVLRNQTLFIDFSIFRLFINAK